MIEQNKELSEYLSNNGVNSTITVDSAITDEYSLQGYPINSQCKHEGSAARTFVLEIYPPLLKDTLGKLPGSFATNSFAKNQFDESEFCQHYRATCSTCGQFHFDLVLDVQMKRERYDHGRKTKHNVSIRKVAHFPEPPVKEIGKELQSILNENTVALYSKALNLRKAGYGIGAFAYLRRVVELLIRELAQDFGNKHVDKIIEGLGNELPDNLKNGDNPIKLLWGQFSVGLHQLTDEECLTKVEDGIKVLGWVVKEIYNERNEGVGAKETMKRMKV